MPTSLVIPIYRGKRARPSVNADALDLAPTEVDSLQWLLHGGLTDPDGGTDLAESWGLCSRHAAGLLLIEVSGKDGAAPATALLSLDLIEGALAALIDRDALSTQAVLRRLHTQGRCPICRLGLKRDRGSGTGDGRPGAANSMPLRRLADETRQSWESLVCRECSDGADGPLCRVHLARLDPFALHEVVTEERAALGAIARNLIAYARSYRGGHQATRGAEAASSLIAAVGWCSGWSGVLAAIGWPVR